MATACEPSPTYSLEGFDDGRAARLIEQVSAARPTLAQHAEEGERRGWLADATLSALDHLDGIWRMPVPRRLGGLGLSARAIIAVSAELAKGDPAAAWVVQIIGGSTWAASLASDEAQDAIFVSETPPRICAVFGPPGLARPVPGGYLVSGRWPYASGIRMATWGLWGVAIDHGDGSAKPGNSCFIPTNAMTIEPTWSTVALQATGSDTAIASDVFVPEHLMVRADCPLGSEVNRPRRSGSPSDRWPLIPLVGRIGIGQAIGIAEAMLETVIGDAQARPIAATAFARKAHSQVVQRDIGEAASRIAAARLIVEDTAARLDEVALRGCEMSLPERAASKAAGGLAMQMLEQSSQALMMIAGSSGLMRGNVVSRYWRDLAMVARHVQNSPNLGFEAHGRVLLNVEPNIFPAALI